MDRNATEPRDIDIEGPAAPLTITWQDGHQSAYELEDLRRMCPCAECTQHGATPMEERLGRRFQLQATRVREIHEVGQYALQIVWGDGHATGLYSFQYLRELCACEICRPRQDWDV